MDLSRQYFISDNLADLKLVEQELEIAGVATAQIHILTRDNAGLERHKDLHGVPSLMKRNIIHSGLMGAVVGAILAVATLLVSFILGWHSSMAGWIPFIFLAVILFGFCTWFGGLHGLRNPNYHFVRFQKDLDAGKHVLFIDLDESQTEILRTIVEKHPGLVSAGFGQSVPAWVIKLETMTSHWWYWRIWRNV